MQTKTRPDWHEYFLSIAKTVSTRASCPRASVGAVIVDANNFILATGYNGAPSKERDCLQYGCTIEDGHCQRSIHAEVNAVAYAARNGVKIEGATLYLYNSRGDGVCRECLKALTAARVQVYRQQ